MTKPLCYVAHPLGGGADRELNRRAATEIMCRLQELHLEKVFVASWITLASVWPESSHYRDIGIAADLALIDHCQEFWLCGPRISPGMSIELAHAEKLGLVIVDNLAKLQLTDLRPGHDKGAPEGVKVSINGLEMPARRSVDFPDQPDEPSEDEGAP